MATIVAAQTTVSNWNTVKAIAPGTHVRIRTGSRTATGEVDRTADDALVVTSEKGQERFDRQQVLAVSIRKAGHRKRNALIGLAAGAGVGLVIGLAARAKPGQLQIISNSAVAGGITAAGALGGTIVGLVLPTGGWREVYRN
jgi:hypothetical protein